jgi:hypothetical protein
VSSLPCHLYPLPPQLAFFSAMRSTILGFARISCDSAAALALHFRSPWLHLSRFAYWSLSHGSGQW